MENHFSLFVDALKKRLNEPLPGEMAHQDMMPVGRRAEQQKFPESEIDQVKLGGVLILLLPYEDKISFPLTLRHDYPGVHAGQVSFPGGKKEEQDKDIITTALRETEEEIGVRMGDIQVLGSLSELFIPPSKYRITPTVGYVNEMPSFSIDPREVKELFLADLEHITEFRFRKTKDLMVRGNYRLNTPYFDIRENVVWGATAMILSEFSKIIEEVEQKL